MQAKDGESPAPGPAVSAATPPLFRQRNFLALWWGQLISLLGERLTYLALVGLLAEHTNHFADPKSSQLLSLLAIVMLAPVLMFAPFTGAWVDRWNLRHVLIWSDLLRAGLVALIPLSYATSHHTLPVYALVFGLFACNVFFLPAKSAITPEIVPAPQLLAANALLAAAGIAATAFGALGGGWIVDHWGWSRALWINGVTYLVSVVALAIILYTPHHPHGPPPKISLRAYLKEVLSGWDIVRSNRGVGLALVALAAVWVSGGFLHVAGNQHIQRNALQPGMERVGVLLAVLGAGAGLGTWWVNRHHHRVTAGALLGWGLILAGSSLVAFAMSSHFAVYAAAAFVVGLGAAPSFTLAETLLQQSTETRQRGRVFSARDFLMRLVFLIGVSVAGVVTRGFGTQAALLIA
ncbi:MAG TPA: MFS transporter, partial [Candidatus Eisenbacteria bacterium]|nr:MFS transporter [Candidatus Eisenbacteria bacterium]